MLQMIAKFLLRLMFVWKCWFQISTSWLENTTWNQKKKNLKPNLTPDWVWRIAELKVMLRISKGFSFVIPIFNPGWVQHLSITLKIPSWQYIWACKYCYHMLLDWSVILPHFAYFTVFDCLSNDRYLFLFNV